MRREVSAKARGSRGAGWARKSRLSGDSIISRRTNGTRFSWWTFRVLRNLRIIIRADGAALSIRDDGVGAVRRVLTDHLVAHDRAAVADADLAGLWFPYILVVVRLSI